ncbi:MAG TPA: hypothetical protein VNL14_08215 [Candidatus Acidoferrales bacterium]|nr:hypothetical protein [Candidatus Acidoferrales bacterium]
METFFFWASISAFVCGCSLVYDSLIDRLSGRVFSTKAEPRPVLPNATLAPRTSSYPRVKPLALSFAPTPRGYDSPELFYQDTLLRIQLGGAATDSSPETH